MFIFTFSEKSLKSIVFCQYTEIKVGIINKNIVYFSQDEMKILKLNVLKSYNIINKSSSE